MNKNTIYLASKPRYEILDGLRGVAALLVVAYHLFESYFHGGIHQPINHGYLAVDFFFALSGFVIGYAYDDRWDRMSTWNFFKRRLIRLHPMVVFGTFFGALMFFFGESATFSAIKDAAWWMVPVCMIWGMTLAPMPLSMDIRGWSETNPLNGPAWSLQLEYLGNILYAFIFRRMGKVALGICVAFFAMLTVTLCFNIDIFGFLQLRPWHAYTVVGGWSLTPDQVQVGITRMLYPFFAGLLLSRVGRFIKVRGGFWWCSLLIVVLFSMPFMGTETSRWTNGLYECICILVMFPLIVSMGAGSSVQGKSVAINKFLGDISYPLYITHYPLIYMQQAWATNHPDAPLGQHILVAVSIFIMAVLLAYAVLQLYDLPIREWLRKKIFPVKTV